MSQANLHSALKAIPEGLRNPLVEEFQQALDEYRSGDWEKVGLKAGKFCEIAYSICAGHASNSFPTHPSKPSDFPKSCLDLAQHNKSSGRSLCIQIPRILLGMYELRNNRSIGHVSKDVSPNHMDAEYFLRSMKWVMAEFVRQFSQLPLDESHALVEAVTARTFQMVWSSGDIRRVLAPAKTAGQKALILLYAEGKQVGIPQLQKWIEYKNTTDFKKKVLLDLHRKALVHIDGKLNTAEILPTGQSLVENSGLLVLDR